MTTLKTMSLSLDYSCSFNEQINNGIKDEDDCVVPCSSSDDESSSSTIVSSDSDLYDQDEVGDEVDSNSSASSSPSGPLQDLSSLFQELPIKRGLSKHYNGKSQSFTSLANAISVEDLAKPENPLNKRLKACKSYAGLLEMHRSASSSKLVSRKASSSKLGPNSSLSVRRNGIPPPHRSTSTSNFVDQNTTLFA